MNKLKFTLIFLLCLFSIRGYNRGDVKEKISNEMIGKIATSFPSNNKLFRIRWNTFAGAKDLNDIGQSASIDSGGNIYMTGSSRGTWGSPIRSHANEIAYDTFVARIDNRGNRVWNTFLGGNGKDQRSMIEIGKDGYIYVVGSSENSWGTPINTHTNPGVYRNIYVAKLDKNGNLIWNTFLGPDTPYGFYIGKNGKLYISGYSEYSWGTPVSPHTGGLYDVVIAKLDENGNLIWNTFLGSQANDFGMELITGINGDILVTGYSYVTWGNPINPHHGGYDIFIARLDDNGNLLANTFFGSLVNDFGSGITIDSRGFIYLTGFSNGSWGKPKRTYTMDDDAFAAKFDNNMNLVWNTFLGSRDRDQGYRICLGREGAVYVSGLTESLWGNAKEFFGIYDGFLAKLDSSGKLLGNVIFGTAGADDLRGKIRIDNKGYIYIVGDSQESWGDPVNPHAGSNGTADSFLMAIGENEIQNSPKISGAVLDTEKMGIEGVSFSVPDKGIVAYSNYFGDYTVKVKYNWSGSVKPSKLGYAIIPTGRDYSKLHSNLSGQDYTAYPIKISLTADRRTERTVTISRDYGEITFIVEKDKLVTGLDYSVLRKVDSGEYEAILNINEADLSNGKYSFYDKYLEKDKTYTYKLNISDKSGNLIAASEEKSI